MRGVVVVPPPPPFLSILLLLAGYFLFLVGITSPAWRSEIGYVYGLWVRCDLGICRHEITGFNSYLALVRFGMVFSLVFLTCSTLSLVVETYLYFSHPGRGRSITRVAKTINVTSTVAEILATLSFALYGFKTLQKKETLPSFCWAFGVTGTGILVSLLGSILRAMGPVDTWEQGLGCLVPKHNMLAASSSTLIYVDVFDPSVRKIERKRSEPRYANERWGDGFSLLSCFRKMKSNYNYYKSMPSPSSRSSSQDRNYRHYEEISFEDMPPPPLELLHHDPPLPPYPSERLQHQSPLAYSSDGYSLQSAADSYGGRHIQGIGYQGHGSFTSTSNFERAKSCQAYEPSMQSSNNAQYFTLEERQSQPLQQQQKQQQSTNPYNHHQQEPLQQRQQLGHPPITPRHTTKQRQLISRANSYQGQPSASYRTLSASSQRSSVSSSSSTFDDRRGYHTTAPRRKNSARTNVAFTAGSRATEPRPRVHSRRHGNRGNNRIPQRGE